MCEREQKRAKESKREQKRAKESKREQKRARASKSEQKRAKESKSEQKRAKESKSEQERASKRERARASKRAREREAGCELKVRQGGKQSLVGRLAVVGWVARVQLDEGQLLQRRRQEKDDATQDVEPRGGGAKREHGGRTVAAGQT